MKKFFQKIILWTYIKVHTIIINVGITIGLILSRAEATIEADPSIIREGDKKIIRKRHRNQVLEKFFQGQTDEKYVREYYELLKKADKFIRTSDEHHIAVAADKYHMNYGQKDQYGKRYEHYGFFDEKHKHAGKTMGEVLALEYEERRTKDDDYKIMHIFNNKPVEVGFVKVLDVVEKTQKENVDFEYEVQDMFKKSKQFEFPIKVVRDNNDAVNKIEQLTEFLHVKKIGFEHRQLEFFIPLKFKTNEIKEDSDIFKELIDIKEIYIKDEYGKLIGFGINEYLKRIIYNDTHEVWKFQGIEMRQMGI
jgi:hypothetical protein